MVKKITSKYQLIEVGTLQDSSLGVLLSKYQNRKKIVIVDENTHEKCWPILHASFDDFSHAEVIILPEGEANKSLEVCHQVWEALTTYEVSRKDLIVNLGGGTVTDTGGFIASLFKRGLSFINIPTTLLGMVDASVGGKTGVNLAGLKNQIGVFSSPKLTICDSLFLKTLDERQLLSGSAEMLKHGLIASKEMALQLMKKETDIPDNHLLAEAIKIKAKIVDVDFRETGERKKLNFGHTIGHSIERFLLSKEKAITHGECVAWGMLVESFLSIKNAGFPVNEFDLIASSIRKKYPQIPITTNDFPQLIESMKNDKKNEGNQINFTLLETIGKAKINVELDEKSIYEGLQELI